MSDCKNWPARPLRCTAQSLQEEGGGDKWKTIKYLSCFYKGNFQFGLQNLDPRKLL